MPHYLVEVREAAAPESLTRTRPTLWTHETPDDTWYEVGRAFQLEGRMVEVTAVEEAEPPFDARLVCFPIAR